MHKDPPDPEVPTPPVSDAWGLPVLPPPSLTPGEDELGYCTGDDPEDEW